jgi:hypothetical protein
VTKVRERLAVSEQTSQRFHMERISLKKLNSVEGEGQYHVKISNKCAALENLDIEIVLIELGKLLEKVQKLHNVHNRMQKIKTKIAAKESLVYKLI